MYQQTWQLEDESIIYNSSIDSCEKVRQWMQVRELLQQMQYVSFMREDSAAEAGARIAPADAAARGRANHSLTIRLSVHARNVGSGCNFGSYVSKCDS